MVLEISRLHTISQFFLLFTSPLLTGRLFEDCKILCQILGPEFPFVLLEWGSVGRATYTWTRPTIGSIAAPRQWDPKSDTKFCNLQKGVLLIVVT